MAASAGDETAHGRELRFPRDSATPGASGRIAAEVLAAERAAVLASLGRRRSSSTPRAPPAVSASVLRAALRSSAKKSDSTTRNANVGSVGASLASVVSPGGGANAAMMSAELWAISRTPPTAARRTLGYRELGANEVSAHDSAPSTEATTEARRRIAALSEAAAAAVEDGLRRLAAARGAREGGDGDDGRNARTEGNEGSTARELTSVLDGATSGAESSSARGEGEGDEAAGTIKAVASASASSRGDSPEVPGPSAWEADKENRCDPELKWSAEDAAKVHAARAAAERAEAAERAVLEQERLAREKMTMSLRELLDARVSLAAATARSVAETAASSAVFAAAEVAALKVTLNSARRKGNPDDPTSEALAEFMKKPLPEMRRVFRIDGTS
mmetsp:Transcript_3337/g.12477  ORF Transcript_3337/g.12477 Transcript_3337/m.12477 type:complete len:390 (+) Transcript_3337:70-1239(+)